MKDQEILVLSVIGPQSSGKSLLLNTLFGAQFQSSAGRCTRGIYGCLIDIKCDIQKTRFKKMLILDTEGIQSTEALDEGFDKRVVFYILCVSHIVLICNKGEMNKSMEDTIKLATDCMQQVREQIGQPPQVNIIMNNVIIDQGALFQTIESLQNSIIEMNNLEKVRQIFTINQSNVFLLPNAFAQSGQDEFVALKPSEQFAQNIDLLRNRISIFIQQSTPENSTSYTLSNWFEHAQKFWIFTNYFEGLIQYSTLEEKKEDIQLLNFNKYLIDKYFEETEIMKQYEEMINEEVKKVLAKFNDNDQTPIIQIQKNIEDALIPINQQVQMSIMKEYDQFIRENRIRPQLKHSRSEHLDAQIRVHFRNWKQIAFKLSEEFNSKRSIFITNKSLQNAIDQLILSNHTKINEQEASQIFNKEWDEIRNEIQKNLKTQNQITEKCFQDIQLLYKSNVLGTQIIHEDVSLISQYESLETEIIRNNLSKCKENFFYYNEQKTKLSNEKFKEQISKQKNFLKNNDKDYFDQKLSKIFYNWEQVVKERFNFFGYSRDIKNECISTIDDKIQPLKRKGLEQNKINEIINQIRNEAQHFGVDISEEFSRTLNDLEKSQIIPAINVLNNKYFTNGIELKSEKEVVQEIVEKYIQNMKKNIVLYFKQNKNFNQKQENHEFRYFSQNLILDFESSYSKVKDPFYRFKYTVEKQLNDIHLDIIGSEPENDSKIKTYLSAKQQKDFNFYQYLKFLVDPAQAHIHSKSFPVQHALMTFFEQIDHDKLLSSLQNIVLGNIYRNSQGQHKTVEALVQELIAADDVNITMNFCTMDNKIIQRITVGVEGIITRINEDMEPYCLAISEHGSSCLHQITKTYIVRIMKEVNRLTDHAPLLTFQKTQEIERDLFIAKLTSNHQEMDTKLAQRTGKFLIQCIVKQLKAEQIQEFQDEIKYEENLFTFKTIIKNIERQVLKIVDGVLENPFDQEAQDKNGFSVLESLKQMRQIIQDKKQEEVSHEEFKYNIRSLSSRDQNLQFTPEEIIMFYVLPSEFLVKRFNDQWKESTEQQIKIAKDNYAQRIKFIHLNFQNYFRYLSNHLIDKNIILATNVFMPEVEDLFKSNNVAFQVQSQKAMGIYLGLLVTKQWNRQRNQISTDDQVKMIVSGNQNLVAHDDIGQELKQPYAEQLQQSIQNERISNIQTFIDRLIEQMQIGLESEEQSQNSLHENELIGNLYQQMKNKALGCEQMCPLCRRQCDQGHDNEPLDNRIHKCELGHQIQGFGGNRLNNNNTSITYGCHELKDEDQVVWENSNIRWQLFKEQILKKRNWVIQDKDLGTMQRNENNRKIWNLIGPIICQYYRREQKIDIKFEKAQMTDSFYKRTLYVLLLDNSESMSETDSSCKNGQSRWTNLKLSVKQFIAEIEKKTEIKNQSNISIITYNDSATLMKEEPQIPSHDILNGLKDPDGWTDFDPPLIMAKDLMEKYYETYENFVLAMMSDGDSDYPSKGVDSIKKSKVKSKLIFKSIQYGGESKNLIQIAKDLGGICDNIIASHKLTDSFIQMIPNLLPPQ